MPIPDDEVEDVIVNLVGELHKQCTYVFIVQRWPHGKIRGAFRTHVDAAAYKAWLRFNSEPRANWVIHSMPVIAALPSDHSLLSEVKKKYPPAAQWM
jgi:hypothetical protein